MWDARTSVADGGKVHLRTGLKMCTCKRQARGETLTTRHLPLALTPHAIPKSLDQHIRNPGIAERYNTIPGFEPASQGLQEDYARILICFITSNI
jgi:hypothetical protein